MASSSRKFSAKLEGLRILILGGTSGIGFSLAEASLEQGALVTVASSKATKVEQAISKLRASYPSLSSNITGYACDLSSEETLESNIENLLRSTASVGSINHIVTTAGDAVKLTPLGELTLADVSKTGTVRFMAPLMIAKHAPKYMEPGLESSITLTGGIMSHRPAKNWTVPAAWGSGIEGIARGLAVDLAPLRVNVVNPGAVHTELFDDIPKEVLEGVLEGFKEGTLVGRVGKPEDLAEAYIFCMRCDFMTGSVVNVDGGKMIK